MILSPLTLEILQNCSKINQHLVIDAGSTIRTINTFKTTMLKCDVPEVFPNEVRLYNMGEFMRMIKLFKEPQFDFIEGGVKIFDDQGASMFYTYAAKEDLLFEQRNPPEMQVSAEFNVTNDQISNLLSAARFNKVEDILFECSNGVVAIVAHDKKRTTREYRVEIANPQTTEDFSVYLKHGVNAKKVSRLELMKFNYKVQIGTLHGNCAIKFIFEYEGTKIEYLIAAEFGSYIGLPDDGIPF